MSAERILILTSAHLCRNPRVVKEATTLGQAGYDVTVVSVSTHERFEQMDLALMRGLPFRRVTLDYTRATPRVRLADFFQRGATWAARGLCRKLHLETAQSLGPASALLRLARTVPADLTIVHTEIPIWAAQHLIREGRRVAVDVEDWYSEDLLHADRLNRPIRLLREAEAFALQRAAYASVPAESMADALVAAYGCPRPIVLRNSFSLQPHARTDDPTDSAVPSFIWFSQTVGPGRGLELFLAAWGRSKQASRLFLLGDERPGYRDKLLARLPAHRRADVQFVSLVAPDQLPGRLAEFDVGLALEPRWPRNRDITVTNKILQYLNAGLAVVATDTAGQREILSSAPEAGLLVTPHETTLYAAQLDALLADRGRLRAAQRAARAAAESKFCWEREAPRLLAAAATALRQPPHR